MEIPICYNAAMKPEDFWRLYAPDMTPDQFMCQYHSRNPVRCIERYVARLPRMYGVLRQRTWRQTFASPEQSIRQTVEAALTAFLEETRSSWEKALEEQVERERAEAALRESLQLAGIPSEPVGAGDPEEGLLEPGAAPVSSTPPHAGEAGVPEPAPAAQEGACDTAPAAPEVPAPSPPAPSLEQVSVSRDEQAQTPPRSGGEPQ